MSSQKNRKWFAESLNSETLKLWNFETKEPRNQEAETHKTPRTQETKKTDFRHYEKTKRAPGTPPPPPTHAESRMECQEWTDKAINAESNIN